LHQVIKIKRPNLSTFLLLLLLFLKEAAGVVPTVLKSRRNQKGQCTKLSVQGEHKLRKTNPLAQEENTQSLHPRYKLG